VSKPVKNPHDALFKTTFSSPEHAAGELRQVLPKALVDKLDFSSLQLVPGSFVDKALRGRHTDLLYSIKMGRRRVLIYILLEHQSSVDALLPFRLLAYMVRIWEEHVRRRPRTKRLPVIIPVVVHHSESGWTKALEFDELFALDKAAFAAVGEHLPRFRFILDDISHLSDEELRRRAMSALGRLSLWCLRHGRDPKALLESLPRWAKVFREVLLSSSGMAALGAVLRYIYELNEELGVDELQALVAKSVGKEAAEAAVTLADRLRMEGREEGRKEGREEGGLETARATLRKVLARRELLLTKKADKLIAGCADLKTLERWILQAIDADTLREALR